MATILRQPLYSPRVVYSFYPILHNEQLMNQNNLSLNTPLPIPQVSTEVLWASSLY